MQMDDMVYAAEQALVERKAVRAGQVVGVVAGTRMASGSTNFMRLHVVGKLPGKARSKGKTKVRRAHG